MARHLRELSELSPPALLDQRYAKYRALGSMTTAAATAKAPTESQSLDAIAPIDASDSSDTIEPT